MLNPPPPPPLFARCLWMSNIIYREYFGLSCFNLEALGHGFVSLTCLTSEILTPLPPWEVGVMIATAYFKIDCVPWLGVHHSSWGDFRIFSG